MADQGTGQPPRRGVVVEAKSHSLTEWRSRQSGANHSLPKFPANREFNRESCKFWGPKTALLISKLYISEGNKRFRHKPEQGICRNVSGNRIQLSAPCSIDPRDVRGPCVLAGENPNCSRCSTQFKGILWHNLSMFRR